LCSRAWYPRHRMRQQARPLACIKRGIAQEAPHSHCTLKLERWRCAWAWYILTILASRCILSHLPLLLLFKALLRG